MIRMVFIVSLFVFIAGCGITRGSFNPETKEVSFWMGKEYDKFVLYYESNDGKLYVVADKVKALESQKLIPKGIESFVKGAVKGIVP